MFPWSKGKEKLMAVHGASQTCGFSWGLGTFEGVLHFLVIFMISSDSPSREPMSIWTFPKSWVLLRFMNAWGCTSKDLSWTHTLEWSSLKNPSVHGVLGKNWGGHSHALEWYSLKKIHKDMEVLTPSPKEWRSKALASDTSWTCDFSWWLGTCEDVPQRIYGGTHILKWYFLNLWILLRVGYMWGCASRKSSCSHTLSSSLKRNHECRILPYSIPLFPFYQGKKEYLCRSLSQSTQFLHNFHKLWNIGNYQIYILLLITLSTYAGIIFQYIRFIIALLL